MNLHAGFLYYKNDTNENECQLILKSFYNVIFLSKKRKNAGKKFDNLFRKKKGKKRRENKKSLRFKKFAKKIIKGK